MNHAIAKPLMGSIRPDIDVTRRAIGRVAGSLSETPGERAFIAAKAAFEYISVDQDAETAARIFALVKADPTNMEAPR